MKITGGALRGRVVPGRPGAGTRPTASRVREALFSMLGQDLSGLVVLDAFGGSGILSFEALSRGAERAVIVEQSGAAARQIKQAAAALGLAERVQVRRGSSPAELPEGPFDLALLDPPYAMDPAPTLAAVAGRVSWRVVLEHAARRPPPEVAGLRLEKAKRYGDTGLAIYGVV